jgi:ABC-2 type transport system ATP-binding protein
MTSLEVRAQGVATTHAANATPAAAPPAAVISVENLSKTYSRPLGRLARLLGRRLVSPPVEALCGLTFEVHTGEVFGLIGRNGAGKTTLTKIIATLVQPTAGTVRVSGYDSVREHARVREQLGLANAEERSFYWRLTVEQNLMFFARLYGLTGRAARGRIAELLAQFELEGQARRRFGELSTGNKQRLAVARALLNAPPVVLLDEPTRSLDPLAAARMRALLTELVKGPRPTTILLTSHNLAEVEELCDRVGVISHGRLRAVDTPRAIRARHEQQERISLTVSTQTREPAVNALARYFTDLRVRQQGETTEVAFTRVTGDLKLDAGMRALLGSGAQLLGLTVERATLLDVLEGYEREAEAGREHIA